MEQNREQPDANQIATRVIGETISRHSDALPADIKAAWAQWSRAIAGVDNQTMLLLRAAFEAGIEAAKQK